ncbi:VOC family protein [Synechococcus sp. PCC 6312]|uniref:VOC family protein n=1 Tax=Synechococcus sp. (strain ATCC 27167 / PCC 6312) TaxID=195253 RepID=UPI00029ED757|nr:VOC family protein [Synechococcus sp. PCC 6312]AFY62160.1 putative ring-cleavage extradiol dioxygenase [Synechococcus sp. PCC 6312]
METRQADYIHFLHVAIHVTDLTKASEFYGGILQLPLAPRNLSFPGLWYQVGPNQIHVIVSESRDPPPSDHRWGRNPHLALGVQDLEAIKERLQAAGYRFQASNSGRAAIFVQDADQNIIELSQMG